MKPAASATLKAQVGLGRLNSGVSPACVPPLLPPQQQRLFHWILVLPLLLPAASHTLVTAACRVLPHRIQLRVPSPLQLSPSPLLLLQPLLLLPLLLLLLSLLLPALHFHSFARLLCLQTSTSVGKAVAATAAAAAL